MDQDFNIKFIDFGACCALPANDIPCFFGVKGTPIYSSPEQHRGVGYTGLGAEVWSLGILLIAIAYNGFIFTDEDDILEFDGKLDQEQFPDGNYY